MVMASRTWASTAPRTAPATSSPYSANSGYSRGWAPAWRTSSTWSWQAVAMWVLASSRASPRASSVGLGAPSSSISRTACSVASASTMRMSTPPASFWRPATTMSKVHSSSSE